jgi:tripartite ATP-independent transporter DctM subunit
MTGFLLVVLFIALVVLGTPIAFAIAMTAFAGIMQLPAVPLITVPVKMLAGLDSFVLLAVPLFILAANIMNAGKISQKLIDFCISLVGHFSGGLAHANILVSMIFAGVSGSSTADTAGVGKILIPNMIDTGYDKETAVGVTAASSTIGIVIPPSIPMIIYAGITRASVPAMFLGGLVPGILIGLGMMMVVLTFSVKKKFPKYKKSSTGEVFKLFRESFPALLAPAIIIGGIVTGWYTATESAGIACVYTALVSMFYYKTLTLKGIYRVMVDTLTLSSLSLFALAAASALGELLSYYRLNETVATFFASNISSPITFLAIVILFFLFLGTFMDNVPAIILFVPAILPVAVSLGVSPILLGIIVIIDLAIGLVTPPYGLCLLIAASIADMPIERSFKAVLPYISVVLIVVILITLFPEIALFLPRLLYPESF